MAATVFDALGYFEKLKLAGMPEEQARVQAEALGEFSRSLDEKTRTELVTKGDVRETELRLQKEIRETELRLQKEIRAAEIRLIKWQIGGWVALAAIMAKGFNWIGF